MKKRAKRGEALVPASRLPANTDQLLRDLRSLIETARVQTARAVNTELVTLYWSIGERIRREILKEKRGEYGEQIVAALSRQLAAEFGKGFTQDNLWRMIKLAEFFPDRRILGALTQELTWTHFVFLLPIKDPLARDFYAEMCRIEHWSVRTLRRKIGSMLFERTAISRKPAELARLELDALRAEDRLTPDLVFRDPYFLDFLGLKDAFQEKDVEAAILRELESFLIELGSDFAFLARQKRLVIGNEDHYIDLLFYHRRLRRLVVIDLKLGKFEPGDKGQMELYLRWLEKHEQRPGEESPIGLILCAGKTGEYVELLKLEESGIRVAEYLTELLPRPLLEKKLHEAIVLARQQLARRLPVESEEKRTRRGKKR